MSNHPQNTAQQFVASTTPEPNTVPKAVVPSASEYVQSEERVRSPAKQVDHNLLDKVISQRNALKKQLAVESKAFNTRKAEFNRQIEAIDNVLFNVLNNPDIDMDEFKSQGDGKVTLKERTFVHVSDQDAFNQWSVENDALYMRGSKVNKTDVEKWMKETGNAAPPGIKITHELYVSHTGG